MINRTLRINEADPVRDGPDGVRPSLPISVLGGRKGA